MIFSELPNSFSLKASTLASDENLHSGLWLVLVGIDEIPPHIALISAGKYYSLSTRKVDCGTPAERFINTLKRKHISSLFIKIEKEDKGQPQTPKGALNSATQSPFRGLGQNVEDFTSNPDLLLRNIYKDLQPLKNTENTCLSPIKEFFTSYYSAEFAPVKYVFELLAIAQKKELLGDCISLFPLDNDAKSITLPKYTMEQIKNRIHEISSQITSANS